MAAERHINSKRVTIFRTGTFMEAAQTGAAEFMSMSKRSIGPYFSGSLGDAIGTGLNFLEIDILMPLIINVPHTDSTFRQKVRDFFASIVTKIAFGSGCELEIGLELDNEKPIGVRNPDGTYKEINLPIKIQDYIRYRQALGHPLVAASKSEAQGNILKEFYVFDQTLVDTEAASLRKVVDRATTSYLTLKTDMDKVDAMLTLLGTDIRAYHGAAAADLKVEELHRLATTKSREFNEAMDDKEFETRYLIRKMVNTGVVRKIGNQFVDKETGGILGHTEEEVIFYIKDALNSDKVSILKSKTQEAMKNKLALPKNAKTAKTTVRA